MKREKVYKDWMDSILLIGFNGSDDKMDGHSIDIGQTQFLIDRGYDAADALKKLSSACGMDSTTFENALSGKPLATDKKQYNIRTFFIGLFVSVFSLIGVVLLILFIIRGL